MILFDIGTAVVNLLLLLPLFLLLLLLLLFLWFVLLPGGAAMENAMMLTFPTPGRTFFSLPFPTHIRNTADLPTYNAVCNVGNANVDEMRSADGG